jgi:hypothetical protein
MKINCEFGAKLLAVTSTEVGDANNKKTYYKGQIFLDDSHECGEVSLNEDLANLEPGDYLFKGEYNDKYKTFRVISAR